MLSGPAQGKALHKHVDEIDPEFRSNCLFFLFDEVRKDHESIVVINFRKITKKEVIFLILKFRFQI